MQRRADGARGAGGAHADLIVPFPEHADGRVARHLVLLAHGLLRHAVHLAAQAAELGRVTLP